MVASRAREATHTGPNSPEMLSKSICTTMTHIKHIGDEGNERGASWEGCAAVMLSDCPTNPTLSGRTIKPIQHGFTLAAPEPSEATATTQLLIAASRFVHSDLPADLSLPSQFSSSNHPLSQNSEPLVTERIQKSRERNRIHARKTRLRKKEQMQTLQSKADDLKEEQIRLKQVINEKNTANILVDLFSTSGETREVNALSNEDPFIEELLRRPTCDIPDSTNIAELPSLILPGQHASKKMKASSCAPDQMSMLGDGIDYDLLGKDRAKCTPEELDKIRRERNRMHAKRTRDRKRMFMEELAEICRKLEEENDILRSHLSKIDPDYEDEIRKIEKEPIVQSEVISKSEPTLVPNSLVPLAPKFDPDQVSSNPSVNPTKMPKRSGVVFDQIQTLLAAATSFDHPYAFVSSDESNDERAFDDPSLCPAKRRRLSPCSAPQPSPMALC